VKSFGEPAPRFLLGLGVEIFQETASEKAGCLDLRPTSATLSPFTVGADKEFFHKDFIEALDARNIVPHMAAAIRDCIVLFSRLSIVRH
jgi:hypothetical protein